MECGAHAEHCCEVARPHEKGACKRMPSHDAPQLPSSLLPLLRFLHHRLELLRRHLRVAELGGPLGCEALQFGPGLGAAGVAGASSRECASSSPSSGTR